MKLSTETGYYLIVFISYQKVTGVSDYIPTGRYIWAWLGYEIPKYLAMMDITGRGCDIERSKRAYQQFYDVTKKQCGKRMRGGEKRLSTNYPHCYGGKSRF